MKTDRRGRSAINPEPGDIVLFRWKNAWTRGIVVGVGTPLRLPICREAPVSGRRRARIYWRSRTQVFASAADLPKSGAT